MILLFFLSLSSFILHADSQTPRILLTSFEPFGDSAVNLSTSIAKTVQTQLPEFQVDLCVLPVIYGQAAKEAWNCLQALEKRPTLMISLGEADCSLRLETATTNWDSAFDFPDNAGQVRKGSWILPGKSARTPLTLPVDEMRCQLPDDLKKRVRFSVTLGNYVCNNTAEILANQIPLPYGFIHVPHSGCSARTRNISKNAEAIAAMIRIAVRKISQRPIMTNPLPTSPEEVNRQIKESNLSPCYKEMLKEMKSQYQKLPPKLPLAPDLDSKKIKQERYRKLGV